MRNEHKRQTGGIGGIILEFAQSIVLAGAVFVLVYMFVAQPNEVKGNSMVPNFTDGEYLLTDKLTYQFRAPERGEVVVFKAPASEPCAEDECEYIKSIIGLPGDRVMIRNGQVYLNGAMLDQSFIPKEFVSEAGNYSVEGAEKTVPEGQYLCLGDNRMHSRDGREFGPIKREAIVGRAFFVYWPVKSAGLVPITRI